MNSFGDSWHNWRHQRLLLPLQAAHLIWPAGSKVLINFAEDHVILMDGDGNKGFLHKVPADLRLRDGRSVK